MGQTYTLSGDFSDLLGDEVDTGKISAYVRTNLPAGTALIDTTATDDSIRLGNGKITVATDGTFSITLLGTANTGLNVAANTLRYEVVAEYVDRASRGRSTWRSGFFELTANSDLKTLATAVEPIAAVSASGYALEAKGYRDEAAAITGLTGEDAAIANRINTPGSLTDQALTATLAADSVIYVSPQGNDSTQGKSAGTGAKRTLSAAVAALPASLTAPAKIILGPGDYAETGTIDLGARRNLVIEGAGMGVSRITFTGTGSAIKSTFPVNTATNAQLTFRDFTLTGPTSGSTGAGIEQRAGAVVLFDRVGVNNFKYGLILDQTEIAEANHCDFQQQNTGGVWITRGDDRSTGGQADPPWTNNIGINQCNFNGPLTAYGVIDDGGWSHAIEGNSFNGYLTQVKASAVNNLLISANEMETCAGDVIVLTNVTHHGGDAVGGCIGALIQTNTIDTRTTGAACVKVTSAVSVSLVANAYSSTANAVQLGSCQDLFSAGNLNLTAGSLLVSGSATNNDVRLDRAGARIGATFSQPLRYTPPASGEDVFLDLAAGTKDSGGTVPAYGIGRGDPSVRSSVDYRVATGARHRFLINGTVSFQVGTKHVNLPATDTGSASTAAAVGAGGAYFDTSQNRIMVSDGSAYRGVPTRLAAAPTIDPGSIAAGGYHFETITLTGVTAGDSIALGPPAALSAGLVPVAFASAADTITLRIHNVSAAAIDPPAGVYRFTVIR